MKYICDHSTSCDNKGCEHINFHDHMVYSNESIHYNSPCSKAFCIVSECNVRCIDIRKIRRLKLERLMKNYI